MVWQESNAAQKQEGSSAAADNDSRVEVAAGAGLGDSEAGLGLESALLRGSLQATERGGELVSSNGGHFKLIDER